MLRGRREWLLALIAGVIAATALLYFLRASFYPLLVALALAYAVNPLADRLERRGVPRGAAAGLLIGLLLLGLGLLGVAVAPRLAREAGEFADDVPRLGARAADKLSGYAARYGVKVPDGDEMGRTIARAISPLQMAMPAADAARRLFSGVASAVLAALSALLVPVFFYYLLCDFPRLRDRTIALFPKSYQGFALDELWKIDRVLSGFIRGQLVVAAVLALVFAAGLTLLRVKFGLFIGVLSGFLNIVPYVGQLAGWALSLIVVLADFDGWTRPLLVCLLFSLTNYLEGTFLSPRIVGNRVGLSPVQSIMALLLGGQLAGFFGMLIGVPFAAVLKALLEDLIAAYKRSEFYLEAAPDAAPSISAQPPAPRRTRRARRRRLGAARRRSAPSRVF